MRRAALMLAVAAAVTACGELPQPFRHDGLAPELARPILVRAVVVRPVDDSPAAAALAKAMVESLAQRDIPAVAGADAAGGSLLAGWARPVDGQMRLDWVLTSPDRAPPSTYGDWVSLPVWQDAAPDAFRQLADQAVAMLAAPPTHATAAAATPAPQSAPAAAHRPTIRIGPPTELPGDGNSAMARAMRGALERTGILVVAEGGDYMVEGRMWVQPGPPGQDILKIAWVVSRSDGESLGTIDQQGNVPKGLLDQPWGSLARDIAEGGAAGVAQIVDATFHRAPVALQNR